MKQMAQNRKFPWQNKDKRKVGVREWFRFVNHIMHSSSHSLANTIDVRNDDFLSLKRKVCRESSNSNRREAELRHGA